MSVAGTARWSGSRRVGGSPRGCRSGVPSVRAAADTEVTRPACAPPASAGGPVLNHAPPAAGDHRADPTSAEPAPVLLVVVATVSDQHAGLAAWVTDATADWWDRVQERHQLRDVVAVAAGQGDRQRYAGCIGQEVMLGAGPAPVDRAWAGCRPPLRRARARCPRWLGSARAGRRRAAQPAAARAAGAIRQRPASPAAGASRSCRSRSRAAAAGAPSRSWWPGRTGCRSGTPGRPLACAGPPPPPLHHWQQRPNAIPQLIADLQVVHLHPRRRHGHDRGIVLQPDAQLMGGSPYGAGGLLPAAAAGGPPGWP